MRDLAKNAMEHFEEARKQAESSLQAISDNAEDAWNDVMDNEAVSSGLDAVHQAADSVWDACAPVLSKTSNAIAEGAKNTAYVGGRTILGVADVGENTYIGVKSNAELIMGDEEAAVETAQTVLLNQAKEAWDKTIPVDDDVKKAGEIAETIGGFAGETALGAAAVAAGPAAATASTAALSLNAMGKSLETSSQDGSISKQEVAKEVEEGVETAGLTVGARALVKKAGEKAVFAKKYEPNANVTIDGSVCRTDDTGKIYRQGDGLLANHKYVVNGYEYATDSQGRIASAGGRLRLKTHEGRLDIRDSQQVIGRGDQLQLDHRGHLIGDRFDGGNGMENIVAMDGKLNQGDYAKLEDRWAKALEANQKVKVDIKLIYENGSARPSAFSITDVVDGKKTVTIFKNVARSV